MFCYSILTQHLNIFQIERNQQINYFLSNIKYIEKGWTQNLNYEQFGLTFDESKVPEYRIDSGNASTTIDLWVTNHNHNKIKN